MIFTLFLLNVIWCGHLYARHCKSVYNKQYHLAMVYGVAQLYGVCVYPTTYVHHDKDQLCMMYRLSYHAYMKSSANNSLMRPRCVYALTRLGEQLHNIYKRQIPYIVSMYCNNNIRYIAMYRHNTNFQLNNWNQYRIIERYPEQFGESPEQFRPKQHNTQYKLHYVIIRKKYTHQCGESGVLRSRIDHNCPYPHIFEVLKV